nr:hypothetical protein [Kofleriaceae bacterium]
MASRPDEAELVSARLAAQLHLLELDWDGDAIRAVRGRAREPADGARPARADRARSRARPRSATSRCSGHVRPFLKYGQRDD